MKFLIRNLSNFHKLILMFADMSFFLFAVQAMYVIRIGEVSTVWMEQPLFVGIVLLVLSCLYIFGAYDFSDNVRLPGLIAKIGVALGIALVGAVFLTFIFGQANLGFFGRGVLTGSLVLFFIPCALLRWGIFKVHNSYRRGLPWLFIVSADKLRPLQRDIRSKFFKGQVSFLTDDMMDQDLTEYFKNPETMVVLAHDAVPPTLVKRLMDERLSGRTILDICTFYEVYWQTIPLNFLRSKWFILTKGFVLVDHPAGLRLKRLVDLALSLTLLFLSWPLMLLTALAVRMDGREVLFRQTRVGKNGRAFTIFKFRSMVMDAEKDGAQWAVKNDSRITKVGKFIRLTRLDELPQIFNIIRGDMSFVGPRPERPEFNCEIEKEVPFYNVRHLVRPGLTGWAQILYPYGASVDDARQKLQFEIYYIKNYSLLLDLIIVLRTVSVVVMGRGR